MVEPSCHSKRWFQWSIVLAICVGTALSSRALLAQDAPAQASSPAPASLPHDINRNNVSSGLENLWQMMKRAQHVSTLPTRDMVAVRTAFRDVIARARHSTVQVLANGEPVALGTIVGADGYILTKSSEVHSAVSCRLSDGTVYPARVVQRDLATDLVMLHIAAKQLPTVVWDDEDAIRRGRWVATVGLGALPVAIGVVSAAPHRVRGGMLGIVPGEGLQGPLVQQVVPGGGADKAGLLVGDTITRINGDPVATPDALIDRLTTIPPGREVQVTVLRNDQKLELSIKLGSPNRSNAEQIKLNEKLAGPLSKRRVAFASVFEHDSVLRPAQCGGPVVDVDGRALGINIARASRVSSFALPADLVRSLIPKLMHETVAPVAQQSSGDTLLKPVLPPDSPRTAGDN